MPVHPDLQEGPEARRQYPGLDLRLRLATGSPPTRLPLPAARSRWSMPASSSATPTCAAAANTGANGTSAGQLDNKPNTWRDLIACLRGPVRQEYTSPAHLAIGGRSAGGITVGPRADRAAGPVRRRDRRRRLVKSAALRRRAERLRRGAGVGRDQRRAAATGPSRGSTATRRCSDGVAYPAMLLTTGVTDPRVAPFHAAQDGGAAASRRAVPASPSCCASTSTPATASAPPARNRIARRRTPTRSCCGS